MENSNVEQRTNEHEHERNEAADGMGDGLLSADTRRDGGWMGELSFEFTKSPLPKLTPRGRGCSAPSAPWIRLRRDRLYMYLGPPAPGCPSRTIREELYKTGTFFVLEPRVRI